MSEIDNLSGSDEQEIILIIDDDEIFVDVLSKAFIKRGYQTITSHNIEEMNHKLEIAVPDYAVIDLKIDQESGLSCLPLLQDINPHIQMLILTGYSSIATAVSAIKSGAINYACKPLDADEILSILKDEQQSQVIADEPVSVKRIQWEHIQRVLEDNDGNISATARSLGMHRRTLQRKLQKKPVKR